MITATDLCQHSSLMLATPRIHTTYLYMVGDQHILSKVGSVVHVTDGSTLPTFVIRPWTLATPGHLRLLCRPCSV